ncbi:hypothetical protein [Natrinema halophilum]|uniref:Uncharacterized protein n=1 Tax=Natrinema halophilum TaxID=1699371 RepID=A0A7D5KEU5_9EURY|nr:hypothetical protein [Natrinema halophilum]QLG50516.1 hypothetical protein HYG82_17520 [Natrinema halophilum]
MGSQALIRWLSGLWAFYLEYTHTSLHAAATAALAICGILVFVDSLFAVLAIVSYVGPPVVLYVLSDDHRSETDDSPGNVAGRDDAYTTRGTTSPDRSHNRNSRVPPGNSRVPPADSRSASDSFGNNIATTGDDGDTDSDSDDGDTDSDSDNGDTDTDSDNGDTDTDSDDGDTDSDSDDGDTDSDSDG